MKKTWAIAKRRFLINTSGAQIQNCKFSIFSKENILNSEEWPNLEKSSECYGPSLSSSNRKTLEKCWKHSKLVIFFFPYNPPNPPTPTNPPPVPPRKAWFLGPFRLRFGSIWLRLALFRLCFGSVSGPFQGVGWGRVGVGERGFCKGKEYHYSKDQGICLVFRKTKLNQNTKERKIRVVPGGGQLRIHAGDSVVGVSQKGSRERCLPVFFFEYGEKKTDKEKSHKGIWRSDAPEASQGQTQDVPGTHGTFGPDLCVNQY